MSIDAHRERLIAFADEVCQVAYALDGLQTMANAVKDHSALSTSYVVEAYEPVVDRMRRLMETASGLVEDLRRGEVAPDSGGSKEYP